MLLSKEVTVLLGISKEVIITVLVGLRKEVVVLVGLSTEFVDGFITVIVKIKKRDVENVDNDNDDVNYY